ncbi:MAG: hypothetical protein KGZ82_14690 [Bacteroidales bacterium]|nr:hypothetical protein [Bacteroidales bacterium]
MTKDTHYKKRLINHCIAGQEYSFNEVKKAMDEAQREANAYGPPKDRYDGFRNQQLKKKDMLAKQSEQALQNLKALHMIETEGHENVDFGSLVVTDNMTFFVSIGLGLIPFEQEQLAVISTQVPIYQAMRNKKAGDRFSFNGKPYSIISII